MATPQHALHLHQKPKLGNSFIARYPVYNYKHKISAVGGFDTASCDLAIRSKDEGLLFLDQYLGNRVAIYVDNPVAPVWEGLINRLTFNAGGVQYTISLDEMVNRVSVTTTSGGGVTTAAPTDNSDSQAVYGIKQGNLEFGSHPGGAGNAPTGLRDTVLAQRAWPKASITRGSGSGLLRVEMLGFYHTLQWETYYQTPGGNASLDYILRVWILPTLANGSTFFDNTDFSDIATSAHVIGAYKINGQSHWELMQEIVEVGNGTTYRVLGVTPTNFETGKRRLYYRNANTTVEYTARQADGLRIRNLYGQLIAPWRVRPDRGIRISDMLIGWNGVGDDPTETWIAAIDYDANSQTVTWVGDDNTTAEGVFQLDQYNKLHGQRFGAQRRLT